MNANAAGFLVLFALVFAGCADRERWQVGLAILNQDLFLRTGTADQPVPLPSSILLRDLSEPSLGAIEVDVVAAKSDDRLTIERGFGFVLPSSYGQRLGSGDWRDEGDVAEFGIEWVPAGGADSAPNPLFAADTFTVEVGNLDGCETFEAELWASGSSAEPEPVALEGNDPENYWDSDSWFPVSVPMGSEDRVVELGLAFSLRRSSCYSPVD